MGIIPFAAIFLAFSANAEIKLKDNSEILGKWKLTAEAAKLDGEKKNVDIEWDFTNDGILHTKATDTLGRTKEMNIEVKYYVEDGAIFKEVSPGRGKYESCTVVDKNDANMTIKCTFLYFFLTKK
ncbi:MAG: hypothetical protein ACU83O_13470 [Gammaproteobacteria bacterium]